MTISIWFKPVDACDLNLSVIPTVRSVSGCSGTDKFVWTNHLNLITKSLWQATENQSQVKSACWVLRALILKGSEKGVKAGNVYVEANEITAIINKPWLITCSRQCRTGFTSCQQANKLPYCLSRMDVRSLLCRKHRLESSCWRGCVACSILSVHCCELAE